MASTGIGTGIYDIAIVGGGINGAGIAADAAGRGLKVALVEMGDLGGATSSASSKLIHGGLRYLEQREFRLVAEALAEREVLLAKAPHLIWPLRFVLPHVAGLRPRWLIRGGLALYDNLARRQRGPGSRALDLRGDAAGQPLRPTLRRGFAYWDCWVDDARLVILNARAAADRGADIVTRRRVERITAEGHVWRLELDKAAAGVRPTEIRARALVNAAGPWVSDVARFIVRPQPATPAANVRLVKGSHVVLPRIAGADDAYMLQSPDGRVVFALPFEERFTIIGTTDVPFTGDPAAAAISPEEETYLLELASRFFRQPLTREAVLWSYAGVRPLYDDQAASASAVSRDYRLDLDVRRGQPPMLSVYGGKVTTYRRLAEAALGRLAPHLRAVGDAWTRGSPLPGGDIAGGDFDHFLARLHGRYPRFAHEHLRRLARRHGTIALDILGDARVPADMGRHFGAGLTEREVAHFKQREWARTPEDVLWRRSKTGLHLQPAERRVAERAIAELL